MRQLQVVTGANLLIKGYIHQFGQEIAYFYQLDKQ